MEILPDASTAAVFTRNAFSAAPVQLARRHLSRASPRYLLINAGNANAGMGEQGMVDAETCCRHLAALAGCGPEAVLPFSTGVIGERLPVERLKHGTKMALGRLAGDAWAAAARAIMTTDTVPKAVSRTVVGGERAYRITGIAKGAGMIRPDMATMLAFLATDAAVRPQVLQRCLEDAVALTFNRVTVDGDTSTNDACVLVATGASGGAPVEPEDEENYAALCNAVSEVCRLLAQAIVRDGEGATKFITVDVHGGRDQAECLQVAYAIAHSPLVKTAFYAQDPNWGRILAAVGRAGVPDLDVRTVQLSLDHLPIARAGARAPAYEEAAAQRIMRQAEFTVQVDLGRGTAGVAVWTSGLSHEYVTINAEYRT